MGTLGQVLSVGFNASGLASDLYQTGKHGKHFTTLRDYQHASKIFRPNNASLLPKTKNWFHIFFQLDRTAVIPSINDALTIATLNNRINWDSENIPTLGILAKTVKLPNFKFDITKKNQYNRWNLTTTKLNYEPIEISFWDDTIDTIRGFWYAYYQYMIQDPNYVDWQASQQQGINIPWQWNPTTSGASAVYGTSDNWGKHYGLDTAKTPYNTNASSIGLIRGRSFFNSIRVYQFNRAIDPVLGVNYTEYVLVNPVISSFDHDTVDFSTSDFMTNKMSIEYETVLYNSGLLEDDEVASWDAVKQRFFDNTPSPLTNTNPAVSEIGQLRGVLSNSYQLGKQIVQRGLNTGQATTASVLTQAIGTAAAINASQNNASESMLMQVPTVVSGYGSGGLPPSVPTTPAAPEGVAG